MSLKKDWSVCGRTSGTCVIMWLDFLYFWSPWKESDLGSRSLAMCTKWTIASYQKRYEPYNGEGLQGYVNVCWDCNESVLLLKSFAWSEVYSSIIKGVHLCRIIQFIHKQRKGHSYIQENDARLPCASKLTIAGSVTTEVNQSTSV